MDKHKLTVVLPVYNEEENIKNVIDSLIEYSEGKSWKIVVVNDGSTDNTKEILLQYGLLSNITILNHKVNRGYGGALKTGLSVADTELVITYDADGQHFLEDIDKLYNELLATDADMVVGSRRGYKSDTMLRGMAKCVIRRISKILLPINIYDINSGMKIYRTELVKKYLKLCPDTMAFSDIITLVFISQKHLVTETAINIKSRKAGKSTQNIYSALDTIYEIFNIIMLFNPLRIFLPISIFFFVFGILWSLPFLYMGRGVSVGASLMIVVSVIIFLLSLIAEQLTTIKKNL